MTTDNAINSDFFDKDHNFSTLTTRKEINVNASPRGSPGKLSPVANSPYAEKHKAFKLPKISEVNFQAVIKP